MFRSSRIIGEFNNPRTSVVVQDGCVIARLPPVVLRREGLLALVDAVEEGRLLCKCVVLLLCWHNHERISLVESLRWTLADRFEV